MIWQPLIFYSKFVAINHVRGINHVTDKRRELNGKLLARKISGLYDIDLQGRIFLWNGEFLHGYFSMNAFPVWWSTLWYAAVCRWYSGDYFSYFITTCNLYFCYPLIYPTNFHRCYARKNLWIHLRSHLMARKSRDGGHRLSCCDQCKCCR